MDTLLKLGSRGESVKALQRLLNIYPDGIFGPLTHEAVMKYQKQYGIYPVDGIVGPITRASLMRELPASSVSTPYTVPQDPHATVPNASAATVPNASAATVPNASALVLKKTTRPISRLIVHCTATAEGKDCTVDAIRKWHTTPKSKGGNGWSDIGYHYVIYRDGTIHEGRNINLAGAHTAGYNTGSIGIVYVGGLATDGKTPKDTRTAAQRLALTQLLIQLRKLYPQAKIYGHRDFTNKKACPCFDAKTEYAKL